MKVRYAVLIALAAAVTVASVAAASPDAARQRLGSAVRDARCDTVKPYARGTQWRTVDGICFSFKVPRTPSSPLDGPGSWDSGHGESPGLFISKSTVGGQSAEAVVFWTSYPAGGEATSCPAVLGSATGRSTDALARAMAQAPGTKLVKGPTRLTVGGRPAKKVVVRVRRHVGCDPGFFFGWQASDCQGACWLQASVGDKVTVWIVDVHGKRLVIEAETTQPGSHGRPPGTPVTRADVLEVEAEIEAIVESIRFVGGRRPERR
jgi:hypothetical protein